MSTGDWTDDEHEPLAPLPAHERSWRHPSEIGDQQWRMSEPPLTLGRGLAFTTGAVGSLLVLAVLWTMVPTRAGRGAARTVQATVVTFAIDTIGPGSVSTGNTGSFTGADTSLTRNTQPNTHVTATTHVVPATLPLPTVQVHSTLDGPTAASTPTGPAHRADTMLAVPVRGGSLFVTTAPAVAAGTQVEIEFSDGATGMASVLIVDERSGLAVLTPDSVHPTADFEVATEVLPGDELTVVGQPSMSVTVGDGGTGEAEVSGDGVVAEGAPVVNQRGELVALCTHDADGVPHLVALDSLDQIRQAMAAAQGASPVWLGVVINDDPSNELSVAAVDPAGPAAAAGLDAGDVIVAADGHPMADCDALIAYLAGHRPGDIVRLTVLGADDNLREVDVELAGPKTAL